MSATNFNIVNGAGAATYPLANFSWTLLYQKQSNTTQGIVLGKLFDWVTTTGPAAGRRPRVLAPARQRGRVGAPDAVDARELGGQGPVHLLGARSDDLAATL